MSSGRQVVVINREGQFLQIRDTSAGVWVSAYSDATTFGDLHTARSAAISSKGAAAVEGHGTNETIVLDVRGLLEETWKWSGGSARVFQVDDGDGSGPASRCDLSLRHNGEAGSGGKLKGLNREQVEAAIAALQQALGKMER